MTAACAEQLRSEVLHTELQGLSRAIVAFEAADEKVAVHAAVAAAEDEARGAREAASVAAASECASRHPSALAHPSDGCAPK